MRVTDVDLIPVEVPTKPLDDELGIAPYVGGQAVERVPGAADFGEALERTRDVGTSRGAILVRLETDGDVTGWGEVPGPLSVTRAVVETQIEPALLDRSLWEIEAFVEAARGGGYGWSNLPFVGGVEMAMWDARGKALDEPVHRLLGGKIVDALPVAFCLGLLPPEPSREKAREALDHGFTVLKTKASRYWRTDIERVAAMDDAVDGRLDLRLDPNRAWGFGDAVRVGAELDARGVRLQYLEQPIEVESFGTLRALRERLTQPIAINEDAYRPYNVFHCVKADAIDAAVVDVQPSGGLARLKRQAALAEASNVSLTHHSGHDLGLKNAAKLHVLASTPAFDLPFDTTYYAAAADVLAEPLRIEDGRMHVPERPGLAGAVDAEKIEAYRTDG
jgi:L-alanine-DL-glutamate epimerase-like enolase superfamily enzyme